MWSFPGPAWTYTTGPWSSSRPSPDCPCVLCEPQSHIAAVSVLLPGGFWTWLTTLLPLGLLVDPAMVTNPPLLRACGMLPIACIPSSKGTKGWQLHAKKSQVLWELWWEWVFFSLSFLWTALIFPAGDQSNLAQSIRILTQLFCWTVLWAGRIMVAHAVDSLASQWRGLFCLGRCFSCHITTTTP